MSRGVYRLTELGQSVWLDDLRRAYLREGTLARLVVEDGVSGVTSNPAIVERAIASSSDYEDSIRTLARGGATAKEIYDALVVEDIQGAADILRPVYEQTNAADGYVSLEVSPHLAHQAEASIAEALRLRALVDRPNLMIKVPATEAGLVAVRELTAQGVNVNVTLLFSITRYARVADAFWCGLEDRLVQGKAVDRVASVASFFLSRIDTLVDRRLQDVGACLSVGLRGRAAIASARLAYARFLSDLSHPRWRALERRDAHAQRLLWASTSTKDPAFGDVRYVEALIGAETVTTLPPETLLAFRDHGRPATRLGDELSQAQGLAAQLAVHGIDLEEIAVELELEGIQKFIAPFDALLARLERLRVEATTASESADG